MPPVVPQFSYKYRMGAGFPGDVNRTHPASIEPVFNDGTLGVPYAGLAALINSAGTGIRAVATGDTGVTVLYGVTCRAYPFQQPTPDATFGQQNVGLESLPLGYVVDVLRLGYITVPIVGTATKNGAVFVWVGASTGSHVQGGFEAAAASPNTAAISNAFFNGPSDLSTNASTGYGEIVVRSP